MKPARSAAKTATSCCLNPARRSGANQTTARSATRRIELKIQLARARSRARLNGLGGVPPRGRLMGFVEIIAYPAPTQLPHLARFLQRNLHSNPSVWGFPPTGGLESTREATMKKTILGALALAAIFATAAPSSAATMTKCQMRYTMKEWSVFYKQGK